MWPRTFGTYRHARAQLPQPCAPHPTPELFAIATLLCTCVLCGQDELLGYTEREEWAELASIVDHAVLFNLREADRQVSLPLPPMQCSATHAAAHAPHKAD